MNSAGEKTMISVAMAEKVAAVLGGKVWQGDRGVVRVYFGDSWLSSRDDGSLVMQLGRGAIANEVEQKLYAAGLVTATSKQTSYGSTILDDVRLVALDDEAE